MLRMTKCNAMNLFFAVMMVVSSCNNDSGNEGQGSDWVASAIQGDYSYINAGDTITLQLKAEGDSLSGPLVYSFAEKDKNQGTFHGAIEDSLIVGTYHFRSEGIYSSRETVFGILPEGLLEGFGEIEHQDSMAVFVDRHHLRFDHGMLLKRR